MTFKSLFFTLFLLVSLTWAVAAYWYTGREIIDRGLLGTALALVAVLLLLVISRAFGWWRLWRARAAAKPVAPKPAAEPVNPDDQALINLIAEANIELAKHPSFAGKRLRNPLSAFPVYLLVGPEGCGKTSAFINSGLEPQLLAGQGITPISSTRLANLWLAKNAVFAEIGGRAFAGDLTRLSQLLHLLRGERRMGRWRRLWGDPEQQMELRGVVAFCDCKEFTGATSDPERLERSVREWQQRLRAIAEVFGSEFPVYVVVTKCDKIPFFPDFFRRLPESEAGQVLGCTLPVSVTDRSSSEVFAEAEAKRLTASFRPLYHALARRRLSCLGREPNLVQRPGIYEFPRELKRIRSSLVQFLTGVFLPNLLGPSPLLRGYYLTGVRETEVMASDPAAARTDLEPQSSMETTKLFRSPATQIFQTGALQKPTAGQGHGHFVQRWLFVTDLFHQVVLPDRLVRRVRPEISPLERYRRLAFGGVCAVCALLCCGFTWSWANNHQLLDTVEDAANVKIGHQTPASLGDLQALDQLRAQVVRLEGDMPWSYHWGLYAGNRALPQARAIYFRHFQKVLLSDLNALMISDLDALPDTPQMNAPYDPVYRTLKAHLIITSGSCGVDSTLVSRVLKEDRGRIAPDAAPDWQTLANRQIDFYAEELTYSNPLRTSEDVEARDRARQYLKKIKGVDTIYAGILADTQTHVSKISGLSDLAPNYTEVLSGPQEVDAAFSKGGWAYFEKASKESTHRSFGEPCVVGEGVVSGLTQNAGVAQEIQRRYINEYIERWRQFVQNFSVLKYRGPDDAARKLGILADHKSPLLAVLFLTANQTSFPQANAVPEGKVVQQVNKLFGSLKKAEADAKVASGNPEVPGNSPPSPTEIDRFFQPVHWVAPPGSDTWEVDKNAAYMEALASLSHSMQDIAQAGRTPDPAVHQAASQNYDKALDAVRQISRGFKPVGVGGLDTTVETLLEAPIRATSPFIIHNIEHAGAQKVNGDLRAFCSSQRTVFRKYPLQSPAPEDLSLADLAGFLQPTTGAVWKFQQQSLSDLVVKDGSQWKAKDPSGKVQVTPELLGFLNRVQAATDVFYAGGAAQAQLIYTLRPKLDPKLKDSILELEIDGKPYPWTTGLQKQFTWPAPPGTENPGAIARLKTGGISFPFASEGGVWGIFKILADAEARDLGAKVVEWKYSRGGRSGRPEPMDPSVRLEIVSFPGGIDVFNPKFWAGLQCPSVAVR